MTEGSHARGLLDSTVGRKGWGRGCAALDVIPPYEGKRRKEPLVRCTSNHGKVRHKHEHKHHNRQRQSVEHSFDRLGFPSIFKILSLQAKMFFESRFRSQQLFSCFVAIFVAVNVSIIPASASFTPNPFGRTALVLAGGGAKGAYTVGVLETICKSAELANSWDLVTGTSIGAMNAAALAQFKKKDQCGKGVPQMKKFWKSVKKLSDVFTSNSGDGAECPSTYDALSAASSFFKNGGMCSSEVGEENLRKGMYRGLNFNAAVPNELLSYPCPFEQSNLSLDAVMSDNSQAIDVAAIASSDVELQVVATNLRTGSSVWWNGDDPKVFEGVMASAAISPVAKPRC